MRVRRPGPSRRRRLWLAAGALLPLLLLTNGSGANAAREIPPAWPGLPGVPIRDGWFVSAAVGSWGNGLSEVARARQWVKIPAQAAAVPTVNEPEVMFPANDPEGRFKRQTQHAYLFLSSPAGAKYPYGIGLPTTVRTVAFGSIPVEVGLRLEQLRDSEDLPIPLELTLPNTWYGTVIAQQGAHDSAITGKVRVRLTALSVDGVDVGLADCVSAPIELDLHGNPLWEGDPLSDPAVHGISPGSAAWSGWLAERGIGSANGGGISGRLDIPAFSDCRSTAGEDLTPLLTGAVSGPGNAVTIGWAGISFDGVGNAAMCGTPLLPGYPVKGPRGPFLGDPADCDPDFGPPTLDYPARVD